MSFRNVLTPINISEMKSDTYCVATHSFMAIQNHADYCCCNVNKESWKTNEHEVMFVPTHSPRPAWQSYTRKMIAAVLDHGRRHPTCQVCWDLEDAGTLSPRMQFNALFPDIEELDQPQAVIIKPGNTCNLACRMCNPATSSSWYSDAYKMEKSDLTFNEYTRQFETIRNSFNKSNEDFWSTFKEWLPGLKFIDIYGGEPFLATGMFDLLEHGVKIGASKNVALQLHTNATIFNQNYIEILAQYKAVKFQVSVDSTDPAQNDYIRHRSDFSSVIENSLKFKKLFEPYHNVEFGVTLTITPLNVYYVNEIQQHLVEIFGKMPNLNIVTTPEYDIRHLPTPVKQFLQTHIKDKTIVNFLDQIIPGCDIEWPKFCRVTDQLDEIRGQSFAKTFPEWWEMLEPHWVK